MQLTDKQLEDFKDLYYKQFWEKLTTQEALEKWWKLVRLMELVYLDKDNK